MEPGRPVLPTVTELRSYGVPYDRIAERLGMPLATLWALILEEEADAARRTPTTSATPPAAASKT